MKPIKSSAKSLIKRAPIIKSKLENYNNQISALAAQLNNTVSELNEVSEQLIKIQNKLWVEPGHFYSPITHGEALNGRKKSLLYGINLDDDIQLETLHGCGIFYDDFPYFSNNSGLRFTFDNNQFGHSDAIFLYCMLRLLRPSRVIEVGSGFSSGIMLDTNTLNMNNSMRLTFIDPYPERLKGILKKQDKPNIIEKAVQRVPISKFEQLDKNDILFIDSSHISKTGSDVNFLYFEVLPRLKPGVIIHIHDIFYPFEYPRVWVEQGRSWNELYLLRALLTFNNQLELILWPNYLHQKAANIIREVAPLSRKNWGGSIWLKKV